MENGQTNVLFNRRVLINTMMNFVGKIVNLVVWFLLTPFILGELGPSNYGLWILVGSVVAYGSLMDFGITGTVTKYLAEFQAKGEKDRANALISTSLLLYSILGFAVILLGAIFAPVFPVIFNLSPDQHAMASWLLLLSSIHIGLSIPASTANSILRGLHRFDLMNLISLVGTLLSAAAIFIVLRVSGSVLWMMVVIILSNLLIQIPSVWLIHRVEPDLKVSWRSVNRGFVRTILTFSSSLFMIRVGSQMESRTDEIVIGAFMPVSFITPYNIARKLSTLPQMLTDQFLTLILPLASEIYALNDLARLRALFLLSTRLTLAIFLPIGCVLMVMSDSILALWVGEEFIGYGYLVLILTLASLIDTSIWPAGSVIQSMSRHRFTAIMAVISGVSNLLLSITLVNFYGLAGVAMGTLIPTTIVCLGLVLPFTLRLLDVSLRQALREVYFPALWPALPMLVVMLALKFVLAQNSLLSIGVIAILSVLVYGLGYLSNRTNDAERHALRTFTSNTLRFARIYLKPS